MNTLSPHATQSKPHYVYALYYPDGKAFYIGKGSGNRINHHEKYARDRKRTDVRIVKDIKAILLQRRPDVRSVKRRNENA